MVEYQDRLLRCIDCGADFIWSAGEQAFFADKGLRHEPKRCRACKTTKKQQPAPFSKGPALAQTRIDVAVNCAQCGAHTTVPFRPTQGRPVYCRDCFLRQRRAAAAQNAS